MNPIDQVIQQLEAEVKQRQEAIAVLRSFTTVPLTVTTSPVKSRKYEWTDEQRKAASRRAKAVWRAKKKALGKK